jgi:hypothetical protein
MGKGLGIPRVVGAIYHGKRGQNIMYRRSKYHGYGVRYTMGKGFKIVYGTPYQWNIDILSMVF